MKILCIDEGSINQYFIDKNLKLFDVEFSIIEQRLYFQKPDTLWGWKIIIMHISIQEKY